MIALRDQLEGQLWQIIVDAYGYDEDTHLFLKQIRQDGVVEWVKQKAELIESDLVFMKYRKGLEIYEGTIRDITMLRRVLELMATGQERGKYLGPGDDRLRENKVNA